tara:strand:+ start:94 stop:228 length:135 start_codon:yes stop_codon:yes gene_type:complete
MLSPVWNFEVKLRWKEILDLHQIVKRGFSLKGKIRLEDLLSRKL